METISDEILVTLARIQEKYAVTTCSEGDLIHLDVDGLKKKFRLSISKKERILFADCWHLHFDDPPCTLKAVLEGLFSGTIQIVVKFRGNTPVAQRTKVIQDDGPRCISWTSSLVSPFWRPKSYKTFTYEASKHAINLDS